MQAGQGQGRGATRVAVERFRFCMFSLQQDKLGRAAMLGSAALLVVSMAQTVYSETSTPGVGFRGIWSEATDGRGDYPNKYGGGLATYPQQVAPMAIYRPEVQKTFFTFSMDIDPGPGLNIGHAISYYDHQTDLVARPQIWVNKQTNDAHDAPVLSIDDDGYLYLFSMTHGESRQSFINKSNTPYGISSFSSLLSPTSSSDMAVFGNPPENPASSGVPRFSYAGAWYVPNAEEDEKFLLLHTRYISGQRDLFTTTSSDADVWTGRKTFAQIENGQYQTSWIKPNGATVGTIFDIHPTGQGLDWRTDLYYLETSDQAQTWQTVDGITLINNQGANNNPLTTRPEGIGTGAAQVYNAPPGERVYFKDVNYDAAGNPVILFLTSPSHEPGDHGTPGPDRFVKTANWTGSQWAIRTVTSTDHNYDHGSLYVEPDGTWRVIAPFIDGPQEFGTGGEVGMWTSTDQGQHWNLDKQLTEGSFYNHTYVRRPLNANEEFYGFWADGDAWEASQVHLYFTNKQGDVFHLPYDTTADFIAPEPFTPRQPDLTPSISGILVNAGVNGAFSSITVTFGGDSRQYQASELIGARLTDFKGQISGSNRVADIITPPGTTTAPAGSNRTELLRDGLVDTAFVNLSGWSVVFDEVVFNQHGPDIILLDWGSADSVDITIGGTTSQDVEPISASVFGQATANRPRFQSNQTSVDTLSELISATFHVGPTTSGEQTGYAIDLSDFGFGLGAVFAAGTEIRFSDGQGIDPSELFALSFLGLKGDFNGDGYVDIGDYIKWRDGLGGAYSLADYDIWRANFGAIGSPIEGAAAGGSVHVPEPATWALLIVALPLAMRRGTRHLIFQHQETRPMIQETRL